VIIEFGISKQFLNFGAFSYKAKYQFKMKSSVINKIFLAFIIFYITDMPANAGIKDDDDPPLTRILFVFDASQSMHAMWHTDTRIAVAKDLLIDIVDSLRHVPHVQMALRVFGHQSHHTPQDCDDTKLEVGFWDGNATRIIRTIREITPRGTTPIAGSLEAAKDDFPPCDDCRNIIILITDGIERCGGDPCEVSQRLQKKGIFLRPFIIGVGRDFSKEFECVGEYFDARNEDQFRASLNIAISQALKATTAQINLLDIYGNPTESNIPVTFYDPDTGEIKKNVVHTMNHRGLPDTLYFLSTAYNYDMVVHTMPPVKVNDISVTPGKHNIIAAETPRGSLEVVVGGRTPVDYPVIVRKAGSMVTLNVQSTTDVPKKYLTGNYDLEIHSLPRIIIEDVEIEQNHVTTVELPQPGVASIRLLSNGYGMVLKETDDGLELVYRLKENVKNEILNLMPGNYRVVFRSRGATATYHTIVKPFVVESGIAKTIHVR